MADRKVLNKYIPKNFDHERIVKRGRGKDKLMIVRNMLPMSLRCNTCSNYLYIGTKFNMRMQICNDQVYLGIKVFRFYLKCTYCYADITFKTDPKNHDYVVQLGGTRNYEPIKDAQQAQKLLKKMKVNQKQGDSMKYLQNKTYDSKRQMQLMQTLEDIKNLNKRQGVIDPQDLLKNIIYMQEEEQKLQKQKQQIQIDQRWEQLCRKNLQKRMMQFGSNNNKNNEVKHEFQIQLQKQNYINPSRAEQKQILKNVNMNPFSNNSINNNNKQQSGKKFVFPLLKSKLDKYKKKIIKKDNKDNDQDNGKNQKEDDQRQQNQIQENENNLKESKQVGV